VTVVKASISLRGSKDSYSSIAFVDTGARMTLVDRLLAERIGVVYTGRVLSLISISGHILKALEAVVPELEVEGEVLKYEAIAVSDIPEDVKKVLKESNLDENIVIGLLTIERASMVPDTTAETLRKVESFII
jgi:acid stress-induced BolA-like protein IbaG/YrbA